MLDIKENWLSTMWMSGIPSAVVLSVAENLPEGGRLTFIRANIRRRSNRCMEGLGIAGLAIIGPSIGGGGGGGGGMDSAPGGGLREVLFSFCFASPPMVVCPALSSSPIEENWDMMLNRLSGLNPSS